VPQHCQQCCPPCLICLYNKHVSKLTRLLHF
jgi:hypothetical protein